MSCGIPHHFHASKVKYPPMKLETRKTIQASRLVDIYVCATSHLTGQCLHQAHKWRFYRLTSCRPAQQGTVMASPSVLLAYTLLCSILCVCSLQPAVSAWCAATYDEPEDEPQSVNLTYYLHEILGGPGTNGTLFPASGAGSGGQGNISEAAWGTFLAFDSPIHTGPSDSTIIGKATGVALVTNKGGLPDGGVQVYCQHIFNNASIYYKSSIALIAQVDFLNLPPSEGIVIGGTGFFRGWKGYGIVEPITSAEGPLVIYKWDLYLSK